MTIFDAFVFTSGIILIVIGSFLLYSFLIKTYKQNAFSFKGIFFLGPIPIIFNNENEKKFIIYNNIFNIFNNDNIFDFILFYCF